MFHHATSLPPDPEVVWVMIDDDFNSLNLKSSICDIKTLLSQQIVALEFLEKKTWELGFGKPAWRLRTNCFELIDIVSCHLSQIPNKRNGNYSLPWQHYVLQNIQISRWTVQYTGLEMRVYNAVSEWRCWDSKRISRELEMSNIWSHISKIIITNILYVVLYIICNDHHHHHQICRDEQHLVIDLQHQLHGDHQSSTE